MNSKKKGGESIPGTGSVFEKQALHWGILALLLLALYGVSGMEMIRQGSLWGLGSVQWLWTAAGLAAVHQVYVWFCWRVELHLQFITRYLGKRGFSLYAFGFAILGILRAAAVFFLAAANRDTLPVHPAILKSLAVISAVPSIYLMYSVARYFTFRRALGGDHFFESYRNAPLVRKGIFRFTQNGMYTYGFLILWSIALWFGSVAALSAAAFNHAYIWVHYFCTELPDMKRIYRSEEKNDLLSGG
jgi:protein-S-isoprenylcysteine O-methyltransferase Ste14